MRGNSSIKLTAKHETTNNFGRAKNQEVVRRRHQTQNEFVVKFDDVGLSRDPSNVEQTLHEQNVILGDELDAFDGLADDFS